MSWLGRSGAFAGLLAAVVLAAGCGGTILDLSKAEDQIEANVENTQEKEVSSVDCPSDIEVEPKTTFSCTVRLSDGSTATATLMIRNEDADLDFLSFKANK
jgi:Domain of unknown function (DUF4333)